MADATKEGPKITVDVTKCHCCLICVMRCGLRFEKCTSPRAAKIRVHPFYDCWPEISFAEDCDACGICVRHCPTGAIAFEEDAAA